MEKRGGVGERESLLLTSLMGAGKRVFGLDDAVDVLGGTRGAAKKLLSDLVGKGWAIRLTKGVYLAVPLEAGPKSMHTEHELLIASRLADPYYVGFWNALNFHGLTEQTPFTVFVAAPKERRPMRILGINYRFVKVGRKDMFGFKAYRVAGGSVMISDPEKTIVDCLSRPDLCGGVSDVAKAISSGKLDLGRLASYAEKSGGAALKRAGFLLEKSKLQDCKSLLRRRAEGYVYLDPLGPKKGRHDSRWRVIDNLKMEEES
jgi:predicted transcriptional regulator of viral defense system